MIPQTKIEGASSHVIDATTDKVDIKLIIIRIFVITDTDLTDLKINTGSGAFYRLQIAL